ncbi:MAG: alpha-L-fucosidase [Saprospiraceae bacterium]
MKKCVTSLLVLLLLGFFAERLPAQHDARLYIPPQDPEVAARLESWQDLKLGLLMHWGTYSQWGIVESWSLCPEDEGWCQRKGPYSTDWYAYKKAYENLQTSFNPTGFEPEAWAQAAQRAGMKYMVFTTKHHDGFCMFDTKQTDYKITDPSCPFSADSRSNVAQAIFNAFRKKDFMVGAYFSKPDWHSNDFWWSYFPPKDRNINYSLEKYPERYQAFREFTFRQLEELCTDYGKLDILWLDGAWVRPDSTIDRGQSWQAGIPNGQDLEMERIAAMARTNQPGILIVDRWVPGPYENYLTPEQGVPDKPLGVPWETCMTMGKSWSYIPNESYKSQRQLVHTLCKVVSRGGNLLLNIAPGPDGKWHQEAYERLEELGAWMDVNGEAIYGTRMAESGIFEYENWVFTQKEGVVYAFYLADESQTEMPDSFTLPLEVFGKKANCYLLGGSDKPLKQQVSGEMIQFWPSKADRSKLNGAPAWTIKFTTP